MARRFRSPNRNIAKFLGKTEVTNTTDTSLATVNDLSAGVTVYATADDLPLSDVEAGSQAYVSATQRLYIWTGAGWFNIALINTSPSISVSENSPIELDNSGGTTTVNVTSTDPEGVPITYSAVTNAAFDDFATVTNVDGVFTITPKPTAISAGTNDTGSITFRASDGVNIASDSKVVNLIFQSIDTLTSSTNSVNEGSTVTFYLNVTGYPDGTTFPYTISGVSSADLNGLSLTGNINVFGGTAALDLALAADTTTEGTETITFSAGGLTKQVTVNDTSVTGAGSAFWSDGQNQWKHLKANISYSTWSQTSGIEMWVYHSTQYVNMAFITNRDSSAVVNNGDWWLDLYQENLRFGLKDTNGVSHQMTPTAPIPMNTWTHINIRRSLNTLYLALNGTTVDTYTLTNGGTLNWMGSNNGVLIGGFDNSSNYNFNGYISDLRFGFNSNYYGANNFTPPATSWKLSGVYSHAYMCHDAANPLAFYNSPAGTGLTSVTYGSPSLPLVVGSAINPYGI